MKILPDIQAIINYYSHLGGIIIYIWQGNDFLIYNPLNKQYDNWEENGEWWEFKD